MPMALSDEPVRIHSTLIERLTVDAMVLADEIESYFGGEEFEGNAGMLEPAQQALVARAGLRLSRLVNALVEALARNDAHVLPQAAPAGDQDWMRAEVAALPPRARALVEATRALTERIEGLQSAGGPTQEAPSPARALQAFLAEQLGIVRD